MKKQKIFKHFIMSVILLISVLILFGKSSQTVEAASGATVKKVTSVNELTGSKTIKLAKGKTAYLKTTVTVVPDKPENKTVTYKSSNKKVAIVTSQGMIIGKKPGKAKITVTSEKDKKKKAVVNVTVVKGSVKTLEFDRNAKTPNRLKKGDAIKLKVSIETSAGGSKDVVWTTSNKNVAKVDKNGMVKAVGNGWAYITATAADGTGEADSFYLEVDNYKTKYKYEVKFFNQPYSVRNNFVYVKTNNPSASDFAIRLYTMDDELERLSWVISDCDYADLKNIGGVGKVKGGYLWEVGFHNVTPGKHKVRIEETTANGFGYVNLGYIDVKDFDKELEEWMQSVIDEVTTSSMTKKEKMEVITNYMRENSIYYKTSSDSGSYVFLAAEEGVPFWKDYPYELNSFDSPALLVRFGEMIHYPLKNLYDKYEYGTKEWSMYHMCAESVEDDSRYKFCHAPDNVVDVSKVKQINLSKWKFYECYK